MTGPISLPTQSEEEAWDAGYETGLNYRDPLPPVMVRAMDIPEVQAVIAEMGAKLARVEALHPVEQHKLCGFSGPCPTRQALDGETES